LYLEAQEFVLTRAQCDGCPLTLVFHESVNLPAQREIRDAHEAPRVHQADLGSAMSSLQQPLQRLVINGAGLEVAHVAPLGNRPVNRGSLGIAESEA
jgi:hypothetical protein